MGLDGGMMRAGEMGVLRCVVCRDAGSGPIPIPQIDMTIDTTRRLRGKKKKHGSWHLLSTRQPAMSGTLDWRDVLEQQVFALVPRVRHKKTDVEGGIAGRGQRVVPTRAISDDDESTASSVPREHAVEDSRGLSAGPHFPASAYVCSRVDEVRACGRGRGRGRGRD